MSCYFCYVYDLFYKYHGQLSHTFLLHIHAKRGLGGPDRKVLFPPPARYFFPSFPVLKDTLWVLRHDEPLVHVSVDISLITKHILDHDTSLES